jgi:hypothetical protein
MVQNGCSQWSLVNLVSALLMAWVACGTLSGTIAYALGFGFRFGVHDYPDSLAIYIVEYLFIILSVSTPFPANYISHKPSDSHAPSSRQIMFFWDASRGVLAVKHMYLYQYVGSR